MSKIKWGGIRLGEKRIYLLQYADDVVAEEEGEINSMLEKLERSFIKKGLELM